MLLWKYRDCEQLSLSSQDFLCPDPVQTHCGDQWSQSDVWSVLDISTAEGTNQTPCYTTHFYILQRIFLKTVILDTCYQIFSLTFCVYEYECLSSVNFEKIAELLKHLERGLSVVTVLSCISAWLHFPHCKTSKEDAWCSVILILIQSMFMFT